MNRTGQVKGVSDSEFVSIDTPCGLRPMNLRILTLEEVCQHYLKISVQTGRNRLSQSLPMPPSFKVGRRRLFIEDEVGEWIMERAYRSDGNYIIGGDTQSRSGRPRQNCTTRLV